MTNFNVGTVGVARGYASLPAEPAQAQGYPPTPPSLAASLAALDIILMRQQELNNKISDNLARITSITDRLFGGVPEKVSDNKRNDPNPTGAISSIQFLIEIGVEIAVATEEQIVRLERL